VKVRAVGRHEFDCGCWFDAFDPARVRMLRATGCDVVHVYRPLDSRPEEHELADDQFCKIRLPGTATPPAADAPAGGGSPPSSLPSPAGATFMAGAYAQPQTGQVLVLYAHGLLYLSLEDAERIAADIATACAVLRRDHPAQTQTWPVETR
jgi:hypothetical protein